MKSKRIFCLFAAALTALSASACDKKSSGEGDISIPILEASEEMTFETETAEIGTISRIDVVEGDYGYPYAEAMTFGKSGVVEKVYFDPENEVKKGDLLIKLNTDEIDEQIETQQLRVDAAQETLDKLKKSGAASKEIEFAQIDLDIEKNNAAKLENSRKGYEIYAPFSGFVTIYGNIEDFKKGTEVRSGQYFGAMSDRSRRVLSAKVYQKPLENVSFGTKVDITQGEQIATTGIVTDVIYNEAGEYSNYVYVVTPDDESVEFFDFGGVSMSFRIYEKTDVVLVPSDAVVSVGDRTFVYVLVDGIKTETDVETGITDNVRNVVEITSGLSGGETIVIN